MSALLIALTKVFFAVAKAVGVLPFGYSFKRSAASTSIFWACYTAAVIIGIAALATPVVATLLSRVVFLQKQVLLSFVGTNRYIIVFLCSASTLLIQLLKHRSAIYCCNETVRIFNSLRTLPVDGDGLTFDRNFMLQMLAKGINLWALTQMTVFYIVHDNALRSIELLLAFAAIYVCQLMLVMTLNVVFGATLLLTAFTRHLNKCLEGIFRDIRALRRQPGRFNSLKMQRYCEFADALDEMMALRRQVGALGLMVNQQFRLQIPILLLSMTLEITIQFYIIYFVVTDDRPTGPRVMVNPTALCYILGWFLDLTLTMGAAERLTRSSAETRWIVRVKAEVGRVDVRLERTLELFAFHLHEESAAQASCRLFDMGNRCMFMMCVRILTLTLILMQFDAVLKQKGLE